MFCVQDSLLVHFGPGEHLPTLEGLTGNSSLSSKSLSWLLLPALVPCPCSCVCPPRHIVSLFSSVFCSFLHGCYSAHLEAHRLEFPWLLFSKGQGQAVSYQSPDLNLAQSLRRLEPGKAPNGPGYPGQRRQGPRFSLVCWTYPSPAGRASP